MNSSHQKSICLAMLVKDEAAIIERCLASARDVIDTWLIIDTGASDDTASKSQSCGNCVHARWWKWMRQRGYSRKLAANRRHSARPQNESRQPVMAAVVTPPPQRN